MKNALFKAGTVAAILVVVFIILGPLLFGIFIGSGEFFAAFHDEEVIFAIKLSLKTSIISTLIVIPLTLLATTGLYFSNFRYKHQLKSLITSPMSLPHIVTGIMLILFFGKVGIGDYLKPLGLDFIFTVQGILLAQVVINIPFTVEQLWAALAKVDEKVVFMGRSLGANEYQLNTKVILPTVKPDIIAAILMCFSRALGEYGAVMMVAGTTRMKTEVLPTAILLNMSTGNMDRALAISIILIAFAVIVSLSARCITKGGNLHAQAQ